jgi:hypothetical protein
VIFLYLDNLSKWLKRRLSRRKKIVETELWVSSDSC